jgi:hypothetical protein
MRILKTDAVAGLPVPAARDFLRRVRLTDFDEELALSLLERLGASDPKSALDSFKRDRYTEPAEHSPNGCRWWGTTTPGNALAMAGFGKPITPKTADRLVTEMVHRARAYNADPAKPGYVQRLRVLGSYLDRSVDPLGMSTWSSSSAAA